MTSGKGSRLCQNVGPLMLKARVEKKEPKEDRKGRQQEESQKQKLSFKEKRAIHSVIFETKQRGSDQTLATWNHG